MDAASFQRYAVWGLGRSGHAAANLLARRGRSVIASDPGVHRRPETLHDAVEFVAGPNTAAGCEAVVVSPGLKPSLPLFAALAADVPVISEIELAWAMSDVPFLGITGTDGKTTTTELLHHFMSAAGRASAAAGNIGTPLCDVIEGELDVVVAEVSAFQLWSTHRFAIAAGAFTNIAADHLDYFETWDEYTAAKHRMVAESADATVAFNWDDPIVRDWGERFPGGVVAYSAAGPVAGRSDAWYWDRRTDRVVAGEAGPRFDVARFREGGFRGAHNVANFMAAAAVAVARGVGLDDIDRAMASFRVGRHRIEHCGEVGEVRFYDDSKATNANAALAGIRSLDGELVVIAGGVDKGIPLDELARELTARARAVVLIGEIAERFEAALREAGMEGPRILRSSSMDEAVERAYGRAKPAGVVLLSPACSSFDMFESYAHRGDLFQQAVARLG